MGGCGYAEGQKSRIETLVGARRGVASPDGGAVAVWSTVGWA
jgi:hypothetical protein